MDSNWRPTAGADPTTGGVALGTSTGAGGVGGTSEPIANPDWRSQLQPEARHRIVTKIMETLKRHLPVPVPEGLNELQKIAVRFEEKIYSAATSQPDYLRKISLKMLSMETKTQGPQINPSSNPNLQNPNLQNPGLGNMQATSNPNPNPSQNLSMPQTSRQIPINPQQMPPVTQQSPPVTSDIYSQRRQANQIPGNQIPGNQIPGNQMPGNQIPGNQMTGNQMTGNQMPVNQNQMVYQQIMRQKILQQQQMGSGGMTGGMQVQQTGLNPLQQQQQQLQMQQNQMRQNQIQQNQLQQQNQMMNMNNNNNNSSNNNNNGNNMNMNNNMNNMQQRRMMVQQNQNLLSQFQNQQPGGNNNNMNNNNMNNNNMNNTNNMNNNNMNNNNMNNNTMNNNNMNNTNMNNNNNMNNNMMQLQQQQRLQTQNITNNINNNMNNTINNNNVNTNNNVSEQQKQFIQQQRVIQDVASSPASMDSTAQTGSNESAVEEVYQKLKSMKETYYNDLREIYQRLSIKLNQIDPAFMGDPKAADQIEKMKNFKNALERFLSILQLNKSTLQHQVNMKEKLIMYEKQINNILQSHKKTPPVPAQQSQIPPGQQSDNPPQQIDNNHHIQQGNNSNSNNNFIQNDGIQANTSSNFSTMNPPQNVGAGTGTGTGMMMSSHNNMMSQQQQQTLNLKQQQEAAVQQRMIQQNQQLKQRHLQLNMIQKQQLLQQQQQKQQQNISNVNQQSQIPNQLNTDSLTDIKPRMKPGTSNPYQQPLYPSMNSSRTGYFHPNLKPGGTGSPQLQSSLSPSPQIDQVKLERAHLHTNSPLQNVPSPLIPDETKPVSNLHNNNSSPLVQTGPTGQPSQSVQSIAVGTPGISASPLLAEFTSPEINGNNFLTGQVNVVKSTVAETPIERLAKALRAGSNKQSHSSLRSAVTDIGSVVTLLDRVAGSAPGNGSRAAVGDDLVAMTRCRVQAKRLNNGAEGNGGSVNKKVKRDTSAMPLNDDDGEEEDNGSDGEVHGLMEEIREINSRLIDTELTLNESESATSLTASSASSEGTIIKCIYTAVAISPGLRSHFASSQLSPILPLRLLVPSSYPKSSPIILDKLPEEQSRDFDDLSTKARSQFSACLRSLCEPLDLKEIAKTWDICARNVILEYAVRIGGGSFSSGFGTWQNCVGA